MCRKGPTSPTPGGAVHRHRNRLLRVVGPGHPQRMTRPKTPRPPEDPRNGPVLLRSRLLAEGHTDRSISRLLRNGELVRVRRGGYASRSAWEALDDAGRHGLRARSVLQQASTAV